MKGEGPRIDTTKSGSGRTVEMSRQLAEVLNEAYISRKREQMAQGRSSIPPWVFASLAGTPLNFSNVGKAFKRILKGAGLPGHFSPHCLRHTYASLLLQQGESPAYVQEQLGHASIELTVGTYGKWLRKGDASIVDRLDDPGFSESGSKVVANGGPVLEEPPQSVDSFGEPWRNRTSNLLIKSQLLCQLS